MIFQNFCCFRYFKSYLKNLLPYAYALTFTWTLSSEHTGQELMRTLSVRLGRNWCIPWAYQSGTDVCTEHMGQELMHALSLRMKFERSLQNMLSIRRKSWCVHWAYASWELMWALSIRVRNWCVCWAYASEVNWCLAPPKIKIISLYFRPKVIYPNRPYGLKIMKIRAIENLPLEHL